MNRENNTCYKPVCKLAYKCGICGKEYDEPVNRAKCEIACAEKKEAEARKAAERKKAAEYEARKKEVDAAFDRAYELREKFLKDYNTYEYIKTTSNFSNLLKEFDWLL